MAALATTIAAANPDAVFYGGFSDSGPGLLRSHLVKLGYNGLLVGGDGIVNSVFVMQAGGDAANGTYATTSYFDIPFSTSATTAAFIKDYSAHYPAAEVTTPGTAEAYDASMVLITAIRQLIRAGQPVTRAAMIKQVQHIQYSGLTGPISFDENGDIAHAVFTVYALRAGHWVFVQYVSV
jgi:branched-chain amino acid transport system substrate-binding protein